MRNSKNKRQLSVMLFIVICTLLISTVAYAHVVYHYPSIGTYNYVSYHQHDRPVEGEWIYTYFYSIHRIAKYSNQNAALLRTTYRGFSTSDPRPYFAIRHIWDSHGNNFQPHYDFMGIGVRNCNAISYTTWSYNNFSSSNNALIIDQYIWMDSGLNIVGVGVDSAAFQIHNP